MAGKVQSWLGRISPYVRLLEHLVQDQSEQLEAREKEVRQLTDRIVHITTGAGMELPQQQPASPEEVEPHQPRNLYEMMLQAEAKSEKEFQERYDQMAMESRARRQVANIDLAQEAGQVAAKIKAGTNGQ